MPSIVPVCELLRTHVGEAFRPVESSIFGTTDPHRLTDLIERSAYDQLGVPVAGAVFYSASSGCVVGLEMADGQSVVLKAYQPHWEFSFLDGIQRIQRVVSGAGYPCPSPMAGPFRLGHGWATIESHLPDPGQGRPFDQRSLELSSAALVDLIVAAGGVSADGLDEHPFRIAPGDLYPMPHNPIFDLASTGAGAEWIDELARGAWAIRESGDLPQVVAHLDWSANNVRLGEVGVTAVYDWDSLSLASEAVVAGQAAATWRSTGETADLLAPDAAEIDRFISAFAEATGRQFSSPEMEVAHAAAVWVMAYTARCEHALEARTRWARTRARTWLREQASLLL
jgi:hypothetical protein